jgi:hypothetical protein
MDTFTIFTIGLVAGFVCFGICTFLYLLAMAMDDSGDFEDLRTPETFQLPVILHEIDTTEQETIYNN